MDMQLSIDDYTGRSIVACFEVYLPKSGDFVSLLKNVLYHITGSVLHFHENFFGAHFLGWGDGDRAGEPKEKHPSQ